MQVAKKESSSSEESSDDDDKVETKPSKKRKHEDNEEESELKIKKPNYSNFVKSGEDSSFNEQNVSTNFQVF